MANIQISDEIDRRLREQARSEDRNANDVVRDAVLRYLQEEAGAAARRGQAQQQQTAPEHLVEGIPPEPGRSTRDDGGPRNEGVMPEVEGPMGAQKGPDNGARCQGEQQQHARQEQSQGGQAQRQHIEEPPQGGTQEDHAPTGDPAADPEEVWGVRGDGNMGNGPSVGLPGEKSGSGQTGPSEDIGFADPLDASNQSRRRFDTRQEEHPERPDPRQQQLPIDANPGAAPENARQGRKLEDMRHRAQHPGRSLGRPSGGDQQQPSEPPAHREPPMKKHGDAMEHPPGSRQGDSSPVQDRPGDSESLRREQARQQEDQMEPPR